MVGTGEGQIGQEYRTEEKIAERKETLWARVSKGCLALSCVGLLGTVGALIYDIRVAPPYDSQINPAGYEISLNIAKARRSVSTLERLRGGLHLETRTEYETPEVRDALNSVYEGREEKVSKLNLAIVSLEKEIAQLENAPDYKKYIKESERRGRNSFNLFVVSSLTGMAGCFGAIIGNHFSYRHYENRRKKLERKG